MVLVVPEEHDEEVVARAGETGMPAFAIGRARLTGGGCSVSDPLERPATSHKLSRLQPRIPEQPEQRLEQLRRHRDRQHLAVGLATSRNTAPAASDGHAPAAVSHGARWSSKYASTSPHATAHSPWPPNRSADVGDPADHLDERARLTDPHRWVVAEARGEHRIVDRRPPRRPARRPSRSALRPVTATVSRPRASTTTPTDGWSATSMPIETA